MERERPSKVEVLTLEWRRVRKNSKKKNKKSGQECGRIVLFRQASNPHQNIVWIISGLLTIVRIFARILAPRFPVAVHLSEFLQQEGE